MISIIDCPTQVLCLHENLFINNLHNRKALIKYEITDLDFKATQRRSESIENNIEKIHGLDFRFDEISWLKKNHFKEDYLTKIKKFKLNKENVVFSFYKDKFVLYLTGSLFEIILWIPRAERIINLIFENKHEIKIPESKINIYENCFSAFSSLEDHLEFVNVHNIKFSSNLFIDKFLNNKVFKFFDDRFLFLYNKDTFFRMLKKSEINIINAEYLSFINDYYLDKFYLFNVNDYSKIPPEISRWYSFHKDPSKELDESFKHSFLKMDFPDLNFKIDLI